MMCTHANEGPGMIISLRWSRSSYLLTKILDQIKKCVWGLAGAQTHGDLISLLVQCDFAVIR